MLTQYLARIGVDLAPTAEEWKRRQGLSLSGTIELPAVELYPGLSVRFDMSKDEVPSLSPELVTARVTLPFDTILQGLEAQLGPGQDVSASNTQSRKWVDGAYELTLTFWPPEKNKWVSHESTIAIRKTDSLLKLSQAELDSFQKKDFALGGVQMLDGVPEHLYRLLFRANPSPQRPTFFTKGYIGRNYSLVFETAAQLTLLRLLPARGGGSSAIQLDSFSVLWARKHDECDQLAKELSVFWKLPLVTQEYFDD